MANTPGGSFIPKRSSGKVTPVRAGRRIYVFSFIAYILFFGTVLSVIGIYFLNTQAERQLTEHIALLEQERKAFRQSQLEEVRKFDTQLHLAEEILEKHAAPSRIFDELEPVIVRSVQLDSFGYLREPTGELVLSLGGLTESFDVLLFQRDAIKNSAFLASADFVEVSYGGAANLIEGANRGGVNNTSSNTNLEGETRVTFIFEDNTVSERIGYQPRQSAFNASESQLTQPSVDTGSAVDEDVNESTQ